MTTQNTIPIKINVLIQTKNGFPQIELRRQISDQEIIKHIISCAYHGIPITIMPFFSDPMRSLGTLLEKGLIYKDSEQNKYYFNI